MKIITGMIAFLILLGTATAGNISDKEVRDYLPKLLGSFGGFSYHLALHPFVESGDTSKTKVILYFCSNHSGQVTITSASGLKSQSVNLTANKVAAFTVPRSYYSSFMKGLRDAPLPDTVLQSRAIRVNADFPILVYYMVINDYASDGSLIKPDAEAGKKYIISGWNDYTDNYINWAPSYATIVGLYDRTSVTFTMGGTATSRTASGLKPNNYSIWTLNYGDVLQIASGGANTELTGSKIESTKPVNVFSGNVCASVLAMSYFCNYTFEQEVSVNNWGQTYLVPPIIDRKKSSVVNVLAGAAGAAIYNNGVSLDTLMNEGGIISKGWLKMRANNAGNLPTIISSNSPICVSQLNTGIMDDTTTINEFQINLIPVEKFTNTVVFSTPMAVPGIFFPPNLVKNYISLIYRSDNGFVASDVTIGELKNGKFETNQLNLYYPGKGTLFPLDVNGKKYAYRTISLTGASMYQINSSTPIMVYCYGTTGDMAYGYTASAALEENTVPDYTPPDPGYTDCCCPSQSFNVRDIAKNDTSVATGMALIYMHGDSSFNYYLTKADFIPGSTDPVNWSVNVIDPTKDARAIISFIDRAGNDTTIYILYNPTGPSVSPDKIYMTKIPVGSSSTPPFVIKNNDILTDYIWNIRCNNEQNLDVYDITLKDGSPLKYPIVLKSKDSLQLRLVFAPKKIGEVSDAIRFVLGTALNDSCFVLSKGLIRGSTAVVGVDEGDHASIGNIRIDPNPTDGIVNISWEMQSDLPIRIDLIAIDGCAESTIFSGLSSYANNISVNLSDLPAGVYLLIFRSNEGLTTRKIIKH